MTKRFLMVLTLIWLLVAAAAIPASAHPASAAITIVDDNHTSLTLPAPAQRIISLAPNVTEILFSLGLGSRVVGVSSYSTYPPAASHLPVVIDNGVPNIEKIIALRPDLLISADIVGKPVITKLRSLGLKVLETNPHDIPGILRDIEMVGTAAGVGPTAVREVAALQHRIDAVEAKVRTITSRPSVYYELDNTYYTAGRGSYMNTLITMAGGTNVAGTIDGYPQLSAEKLLVANPQYIILGDAAYGVTAATVAKRPGWSSMAAVKAHHVFAFNDDLASRPGPRIVDGLEQLARILHPEFFR